MVEKAAAPLEGGVAESGVPALPAPAGWETPGLWVGVGPPRALENAVACKESVAIWEV
jgi:hypothetical protein